MSQKLPGGERANNCIGHLEYFKAKKSIFGQGREAIYKEKSFEITVWLRGWRVRRRPSQRGKWNTKRGKDLKSVFP